MTIDDPHAYLPADPTDTARAAALRVLPRTGTVRRLVLEVLRGGPRTDDELALHLGRNPNTVRPRRVELVEGGHIRDSGARRLNGYGNPCVVWEVAPPDPPATTVGDDTPPAPEASP